MLLDGLRPAMDQLAAGEIVGKVLVRPEVSRMSEPSFAPASTTSPSASSPPMLDDAGRATLLDFFGEVFGWTEGDNTGETGNPLILYTGSFGQFLYLLPAEPYLVAPALDHFGLEVATRDELERHGRAGQGVPDRDDRVEVIDVHERTTSGPTHDYVLTSAYIGFVLPLMVELQHLKRVERTG